MEQVSAAASGASAVAASIVPIISPEFILNFLSIALNAIVIIIVSGMIMTAIAFWRVGAAVIEPVVLLVIQGEVIRILAVIFIISAATVLAMMGIIQGEALVSILSGVAGYVLGGYGKKEGKMPTTGDKGIGKTRRKSVSGAAQIATSAREES